MDLTRNQKSIITRKKKYKKNTKKQGGKKRTLIKNKRRFITRKKKLLGGRKRKQTFKGGGIGPTPCIKIPSEISPLDSRTKDRTTCDIIVDIAEKGIKINNEKELVEELKKKLPGASHKVQSAQLDGQLDQYETEYFEMYKKVFNELEKEKGEKPLIEKEQNLIKESTDLIKKKIDEKIYSSDLLKLPIYNEYGIVNESDNKEERRKLILIELDMKIKDIIKIYIPTLKYKLNKILIYKKNNEIKAITKGKTNTYEELSVEEKAKLQTFIDEKESSPDALTSDKMSELKFKSETIKKKEEEEEEIKKIEEIKKKYDELLENLNNDTYLNGLETSRKEFYIKFYENLTGLKSSSIESAISEIFLTTDKKLTLSSNNFEVKDISTEHDKDGINKMINKLNIIDGLNIEQIKKEIETRWPTSDNDIENINKKLKILNKITNELEEEKSTISEQIELSKQVKLPKVELPKQPAVEKQPKVGIDKNNIKAEMKKNSSDPENFWKWLGQQELIKVLDNTYNDNRGWALIRGWPPHDVGWRPVGKLNQKVTGIAGRWTYSAGRGCYDKYIWARSIPCSGLFGIKGESNADEWLKRRKVNSFVGKEGKIGDKVRETYQHRLLFTVCGRLTSRWSGGVVEPNYTKLVIGLSDFIPNIDSEFGDLYMDLINNLAVTNKECISGIIKSFLFPSNRLILGEQLNQRIESISVEKSNFCENIWGDWKLYWNYESYNKTNWEENCKGNKGLPTNSEAIVIA